ncbi:MAG: chemotaxis protein CheW [Myxococcota bacterium]|nr:chemotaxis protein CheW [Myxococcota bacterium]
MNVQTETVESTETELGQRLAGKYLTFRLGGETYGVGILCVREIIEPLDITPVPRTNPSVVGVINLRGRVIPLVDLRTEFGMGSVEFTDQTVVIVLQYGNTTFGVLVDEVLEVLNLKPKQIAPPPPLTGGSMGLSALLGTGRVEKRVTFLLDLSNIIAGQEGVI